jgi:hypothetical protein
MRVCVCVCVCEWLGGVSAFITDFFKVINLISFMAQKAEHEVIRCQIVDINGQELVSSRIDWLRS